MHASGSRFAQKSVSLLEDVEKDRLVTDISLKRHKAEREMEGSNAWDRQARTSCQYGGAGVTLCSLERRSEKHGCLACRREGTSSI